MVESKVSRRRFLAAALGALVVAVASAGCTQDGKRTDPALEFGDGSSTQFLEEAIQEGRGAISGVIVDEAIRPLEGVNITLLSENVTKATDDQGRFLFNDLEPGTYFLQVAAFIHQGRASYAAVQADAVVQAGAAAYVRVLLSSLPVPQQPYHETLRFDWFNDAGVPAADLYYEWANNYLLEGQLPPTCAHCSFEWMVSQPVAGLVLEGYWQNTVPDPTASTEFYYYLWGTEPEKSSTVEGNLPNGAEGHDGVHVDDAALLEDNSTAYALIVVGDITSVTVNQAAQIFVTNFYIAPPPEGWSFVNGDT